MRRRPDLSRRDFLRRSISGAAACATIPTFLQHTLFSLDLGAALPAGAADGPILVVVQLGGGNDSLNTVIPFQNPFYDGTQPVRTNGTGAQRAARSTLKLTPAHGLLNLGASAPGLRGGSSSQEAIALHPRLTALADLWHGGELAIVNGVGYPNPNLSHFTSFDFWHTARPNEAVRDGWLGRYFDHQCAGCEPTASIDFAATAGLPFHSHGSSANVNMLSPTAYSWKDSGGETTRLEATYRRLLGLDHATDPGIDPRDDLRAYVQRTSHNALISSRSVADALANTSLRGDFPRSGVTFPTDALGRNFRDIASLIYGGMATRIYYVNQGGYDTHNNQVAEDDPLAGNHNTLLGRLNAALGAFIAEMKAQGNWERVLLFTFSEFGRKLIENGSNGTDHGAAASLFVTGGGVQPGFVGTVPDFADSARIKNDSLAHQVDFRSVYRTVLQDWLQVPAERMPLILPSGTFPTLPLIRPI